MISRQWNLWITVFYDKLLIESSIVKGNPQS